MHLTPKEHPEAGHFYRSDHFSLAKAGVPAITIEEGLDFVGRPKEWGLQQVEDYDAHRYHQPSDEYRSDLNLDGAVQMTDIIYRFARRVADAPALPTWNADAEFHRSAPPQP